jgi:hypothetical protein
MAINILNAYDHLIDNKTGGNPYGKASESKEFLEDVGNNRGHAYHRWYLDKQPEYGICRRASARSASEAPDSNRQRPAEDSGKTKIYPGIQF